MTAPNRAAVEAAARELAKWDWDIPETHVQDAITAALPFLAPQPSRSDEERAREIHTQWMRDYGVTDDQIYELGLPEAGCPTLIERYVSLLAAVRAEATLAGAVAEREACAKIAADRARTWSLDETNQDPFLAGEGEAIAAAIRARK